MNGIIDQANNWLMHHKDKLLNSIVNLSEEEINAWLDDRDTAPFDSNWMAAYELAEQEKQNRPSAEVALLEQFSNPLRQQFYLAVIQATGSADLAAYASDDLGLIFDTLSLQLNNTFVFSILQAYLEGNLPGNGMATTTANPTGLY